MFGQEKYDSTIRALALQQEDHELNPANDWSLHVFPVILYQGFLDLLLFWSHTVTYFYNSQ